ncbi:MAG: serine/threonine-protein kinase [Acutalibacteraceae bacterium]|nr:serine/threonine-protein kinase [Acutalibacteraceae bacterium]
MSNKTEINPNINATVINSEVGQATAINPNLVASSTKLVAGTLLAGKYEIVEPLSVSTGEADLYVCKYDGKEYVAKVYRRQRAVKPEVITVLKSISSPYVASLFDTGTHNNLPFEVLPYYKNGSLQGRQFSMDELKKTIIPCINEALRVLHQNDIIHKDLKPSNIMLLDDNKSVAIIDFGISSVVEQGNTVLVTKTGMTPEYSAPETFRNLFLEESDYYSFGITLYELYCGYTPYKNMNAEEIAQFTAVQRIPFPKDMPQELQDLISAVTYFDITNRNKKNNPNRRWTYTEVDNWCKGKKQVIPGEGTGFGAEKAIPPYTFLGQAYKDIPSLITALASNWNDGKKQLYRGLLSAFFKNFNPEIAGYCMDAEEEATRTAGKDDIIFWDLLYKIYPELNGFYWMGQIYESLPALGRDMLERLWRNDKSNYSYWDGILGNKLLTNYLSKVKSKNDNLATASAALETSHNVGSKSKRDTLMNYYTMAYLLSGQKLFAIGEKRLKNVSELTAHMKGLLDSSYEEFEDFCHSLIGYDDTLDVQLEAWLIALGKRKELDAWRHSLNA